MGSGFFNIGETDKVDFRELKDFVAFKRRKNVGVVTKGGCGEFKYYWDLIKKNANSQKKNKNK